MQLRRDRPALQQLVRESRARELDFTDCDIGELLAFSGMHEEALEIFRRCGMADLTGTESAGCCIFHGRARRDDRAAADAR